MILHAYLSLFSTLLFLTLGLCSARHILPRTSAVTELSAHVELAHEGNHFLPLSVKDESDLLDIALVASVDGKLHALNRTSGDTLWSMASTPTDPATLGPLVRTQHPDIDYETTDEDSIYQELYVIEPQSGEIYVMSSANSPLQSLPFSMSQLVDMSPYSSSDDDYRRVFVGRKETSLLLIELETGRVKATISSECPWDPYDDVEPFVDLDELDGTKPPRASSKLSEVFIGRTDYHISIHTRPLGSSLARPPVQNLSFSTYGPNNQDHGLQSLYRYTADHAYIQPLPNGDIMSFRTGNGDRHMSDVAPKIQMLWGQTFSNPIVAVFDVLKSPNRQHPFVLLQPRPSLQDMLPGFDLTDAAKHNQLPNLDSAYIGLVEETDSLFAMSPDRYPLVVFGDVGQTLDPPPGLDFDPARDLPSDVDSVKHMVKHRKLRELCRVDSTNRRCLTGVRRLESSSRSRLSRLLDGAPSVPLPPTYKGTAQEIPDVTNVLNNVSISPPSMPNTLGADGPPLVEEGGVNFNFSTTTLGSFGFAVFILTLSIGYLKGLFGKPSTSQVISHERAPEKDKAGDSSVSDPPETEPEILPVPAIEALSQGPVTLLSARRVVFVPETEEPRLPATISADFADDGADGDESEREGDGPAIAGKRKALRRKRGKKKKGITTNGSAQDAVPEVEEKHAGKTGKDGQNGDAAQVVSPSAIVLSPSPTPAPVVPSLIVSDTVLGFGSHGTVVFKGSLQGRAVAVKRLLQDFVTLAAREVTVLQESDDHPNVIRYYYQESHANFLYIALELCPASLADVIERPDDFPEIVASFDPKRALRQITLGLRHLHALKIVHRDIKPQNILISDAKKGVGESAGHRMLISDFGLCRKLEMEQTSFLPTAHGAMAAGTVGWRAPEILRGEVKLEDTGTDDSQSSRSSVGTTTSGTPTGKSTRLTKSVDIFALGCLYYYVLTNGSHPFGDRFEREVNILKNSKSLEGLERFGEEGSEGVDLISQMLSPEAYHRPDTSTCLLHPYFWDPGKRLTFLQDTSDRFEIMCRDPRDPNLISLETGAVDVVGNDWHSRLDRLFIENLGKFRKYDGRSVQDLLRALRNKKHHYQDLPGNVKRLLGSMPEGFLSYFTRRFPGLLLHVHSVISGSPLRDESMFRAYFNLTD
ncbi:hypothetical protein BKA93DRAFT_821733 [Sparassis latifolia]